MGKGSAGLTLVHFSTLLSLLYPISSYDVGSPSQGEAYLQSFYNTNTSMSAPGGEAALLKRHLNALSRRVTALESQNHSRYQRDVVLYTIGLVYVIVRGISWLNRRW